MQENSILLPLLILLVLIGVAVVFFFTRRPERFAEDAAADYAAGLNYLVAGELELALQKLRDAVRKDTTNIDAYIKIGDILRELGRVDQAVKVHRDLTARLNLEPGDRLPILRALVLDHEARKNFDAALGVISQILTLKKDDAWAREKELQLLEETGDWNRAAESYRRLAKTRGNVKKSRLALYKVELGRQMAAKKDERLARATFREALKLDPKCAAAYLQLSASYVRENRESEALNTLKRFIQAAPEKAAVAFEPIKSLLFSIGEFGEIENVYQHIIERKPDNWQSYLALAEIKEKKGELDQAIELCQRVLQQNPEHLPAREHLIRYYHRSKKDQLAIEQALALLNSKKDRKQQYVCKKCGHTSREPFWFCCECHQWESVEGI